MLYWPDVITGVAVFVAGVWGMMIQLLLMIFIVGEQRHSPVDPPMIALIALLLLAAGWTYAGSQIMVSRRVGFDVAIGLALTWFVWAVLHMAWSPTEWVVVLVLALCIARRRGQLGPAPT